MHQTMANKEQPQSLFAAMGAKISKLTSSYFWRSFGKTQFSPKAPINLLHLEGNFHFFHN